MIETTDNYLGKTKDGYKIYDRKDSHIQNKSGVTKELLRIAFKRMYANGAKFKKKEIQFSKPIGFNQCLETTESDEIIMVYRKGRQGMTPMVKGRKPSLCKTLTVIIKKMKKFQTDTISSPAILEKVVCGNHGIKAFGHKKNSKRLSHTGKLMP